MNKENVFVIDDPSLIGWVEDGVTSDGDPIWKWDQEGSSGGGSAGAGMIICSEAELPPVEERVTGMQWLDSESSNVYVWDDDKWLMFPATGGQGADGAPGADGNLEPGSQDGEVLVWDNSQSPPEWMPNDNLIIDATGDATFSGDVTVTESGTGAEDRSMLRLKLSSSTFGGSVFHASKTDSWYPQDAVCLFNFDNGPLAFGTNNNTRMTIDDGGDVGIGVAPFGGAVKLDVSGDIAMTGSSRGILGNCGWNNGWKRIASGTGFAVLDGGTELGIRHIAFGSAGDDLNAEFGQPALQVDSAGNVGIGVNPLRSTAKEQLRVWKHKLAAALEAEPKADKKAVTLEITDDAFEVLPTEDKLAKWMETRAAGDRLQVAGNATFSGNIFVGNAAAGYGQFGNDMVVGTENCTAVMPLTNGECNIGGATNQFKDAFFSDTVDAKGTKIGGNIGRCIYADTEGGNSGLHFGGNVVLPCQGGNLLASSVIDIGGGSSEGYKFKDAYFSGTVQASHGYLVGATGATIAFEKQSDFAWNAGIDNTSWFYINGGGVADDAFRIEPISNNATFGGNVYAPNLATRNDLIETLSTLRAATQDETTLEGLRDSISNAIGGLIEKFEAMQTTSTQEISDE